MAKFEKKVYLKDESFDPIYRPVNKSFLFRTWVLPLSLALAGISLFALQVVIPLYDFETKEIIPETSKKTVAAKAAGFADFKFQELGTTGFIENENVKGVSTSTEAAPEIFYLSIPKLGIKNAKVETNSKNLSPDLALGHYPGSALPGETGTAFIYGHSVLPVFYNPRSYKAIFSTISQLKAGDELTISYNNKELKYVVNSKKEVLPDKVSPIENIKPSYLNESTLTLMTCSPAGTKIKRLLVYATMQN